MEQTEEIRDITIKTWANPKPGNTFDYSKTNSLFHFDRKAGLVS